MDSPRPVAHGIGSREPFHSPPVPLFPGALYSLLVWMWTAWMFVSTSIPPWSQWWPPELLYTVLVPPVGCWLPVPPSGRSGCLRKTLQCVRSEEHFSMRGSLEQELSMTAEPVGSHTSLTSQPYFPPRTGKILLACEATVAHDSQT